jgi:heavy metal translocating P-type ATPase
MIIYFTIELSLRIEYVNGMTTLEIENICLLCHSELSGHPIIDEDKTFCCQGCHAVYQVLLVRNQLENYQQTSIFQEALKFGLISNPALLESIRKNRSKLPEGEYEKLHLEIGDLWCPSCAEVIKLMLLSENGVRNCVVDYATDLASIEYSPKVISKESIFKIIQSLGYQPHTLQLAGNKKQINRLYLRFIIAAFFSLNIMMFAYPIYASYFEADQEGYDHLFAWISLFSSIPVVTYCFWPILRRGWSSLRVGIFGMEALVIMGVSTAFGLSLYELFNGRTFVYFDSLTVIVTFVLLGKIIESRTKFSAKEAMLRLSHSIPKRGRKQFPDGSVKFVLLKEIEVGDFLVALTGDKIVLDGIVTNGDGTCDESLMTGESIPVYKNTGSRILGGTILLQGRIVYQVTTSAEESILQKIIGMVENDIGTKTVVVRAADQIVRWFVPTVLLIALGVVFWGWISDLSFNEVAMRTISVLLISCPCAIGIAAPLAESQLLNQLASLGVIVRNRRALMYLGRETLFVFDKTGTVTEGIFQVHQGLDYLSLEHLQLLKGLSSQSNHPVANAINRSIGAEPIIFDSFFEIAGKGLRGIRNGKRYLLGSDLFLRQEGVRILSCSAASDKIITSVYFAEDKQCLSAIFLGDEVKSGIKDVLKSLESVKTVLLSGDSDKTVESVAMQCGFKDWKSRCNPLQKQEYIHTQKEKGEIVCMMGDGINDAPALTSAHTGISVVSATDISIQVSDILLTTDRMDILPKMRRLAIRGRTIVSQNLFWAFFYNCIGIALAATGHLTPLYAAAAMVISSLMVLFNARRL